MKGDRVEDLRVRLREINAELRRTVDALDELTLKAERADLRRLINVERERRAA